MELRCVQSATLSSIPRGGFIEKPFLGGQTVLKFLCNRTTIPNARRPKLLGFKARASGTAQIKSEAPVVTPSDIDLKDKNLVFVAGATGRVGSRTVRELLKLGFKVRAGVRSIQRAESLVQSVRNLKLEDMSEGTQPIDKLELVECDLEIKDQIGPALGKASIVICSIGASEKEVLDITGPCRIDFRATKNLIDAASIAKVDHFILATSLGTNKIGFPAAILNLFWGVLIWKRKAEEALLDSGLPYTIVRPGGMERPTDSYKETHNLTLSEEDTLFGGQVSNLQVAELIAFMAKNRSVSYCKIVEVIAETTAPLTPMGDLLKRIPSQRKEVYPTKELDDVDGSQPAVPDVPSTEKEPEQTKPAAATPLSPYTAYEDLKPPTSPTPTASTGSGASKAIRTDVAPTEASSTSPLVEVNALDVSSIAIDGATPPTALKKQNPLSPYTNYEDLKPPSSPTPTPSGSKEQPSTVPTSAEEKSQLTVGNDVAKSGTPDAEQVQAETLASGNSPYLFYEDLKPPSSPTPTPSGSKLQPSIVPTSAEEKSQLAVGNDVAKNVEQDQNGTSASENSPYLVYNDLKPPSSPSPIASTVPENDKPANPVYENSGIAIPNNQSKASPLSPYTMYEDLKPPSSPVPIPRKF